MQAKVTLVVWENDWVCAVVSNKSWWYRLIYESSSCLCWGLLSCWCCSGMSQVQRSRHIYLSSQRKYGLTDHLEDTRVVIANKKVSVVYSSGQVVAYYKPKVVGIYDYYPFGWMKPLAVDPYPFTYQGQMLDREMGWQYYRYRNYDPVVGRFWQVEPLVDSFPWLGYVFSSNRVVIGVEREGLEDSVVIWDLQNEQSPVVIKLEEQGGLGAGLLWVILGEQDNYIVFDQLGQYQRLSYWDVDQSVWFEVWRGAWERGMSWRVLGTLTWYVAVHPDAMISGGQWLSEVGSWLEISGMTVTLLLGWTKVGAAAGGVMLGSGALMSLGGSALSLAGEFWKYGRLSWRSVAGAAVNVAGWGMGKVGGKLLDRYVTGNLVERYRRMVQAGVIESPLWFGTTGMEKVLEGGQGNAIQGGRCAEEDYDGSGD